jgi:hypothetical protein
MVQSSAAKTQPGKVYCPICTHTVDAEIQFPPQHRRAIVKPGQKCPRCSGSLDAGYIFTVGRAA